MTERDQIRHPDTSAIRDWAHYGPRNPAIATLVEQLAYEQGVRLEDIEQLIANALTAALQGSCAGGIASPAKENG